MWIWKTRNSSRNQPDDPERTDYSHRWSVRLRKNNFSENPEPDGRRRRRLSLRNNYFRRNRHQISSERKTQKACWHGFQQPIAFPHSIEKNLSYVLKYHGVRNKKEIAEKITESLQKAKLYDEVKDQLKKSALKLSGGQKQRLAIARSLCAGPEILLLDEPCSALDMKNTIAIEETLLELKDQYTFVIVTHNLAQAKRIADQVIFMDHGEVLEVTEKEKFFENPASEPAKEQIQYM